MHGVSGTDCFVFVYCYVVCMKSSLHFSTCFTYFESCQVLGFFAITACTMLYIPLSCQPF